MSTALDGELVHLVLFPCRHSSPQSDTMDLSFVAQVLIFLLGLAQEHTSPVGAISNETRTKEDDMVESAFAGHDIGSELILKTPSKVMHIHYRSDKDWRVSAEVNLGNELRPIDVQNAPQVLWTSPDSQRLHVLIMFDPDTLGRGVRWLGSFNHWLVNNIPGNELERGDVVTPYFGPIPMRTSGLHRYIFLLFEQPPMVGRMKIENPGRLWFSIRDFAEKYWLGHPVAGNFFLAERRGVVNTLTQALKGTPPPPSRFRL